MRYSYINLSYKIRHFFYDHHFIYLFLLFIISGKKLHFLKVELCQGPIKGKHLNILAEIINKKLFWKYKQPRKIFLFIFILNPHTWDYDSIAGHFFLSIKYIFNHYILEKVKFSNMIYIFFLKKKSDRWYNIQFLCVFFKN